MTSDLSRRVILAGAAAAIAPASMALGAEPELQRMIRDANALNVECNNAQEAMEKAERAFARSVMFERDTVPTPFGHWYSARHCSREQSRAEIAKHYINARTMYEGAEHIPHFAALRDAMTDLEQLNLKLVDQVHDAMERRRQQFDLARLEADAESASTRFYAAVVAMCALPCATIEDYRFKAQALADIFGDAEDAPDDALRALAASLIPQA